ncbi:hypothetical protein HJB89_25295 [Rhizobium sp. NZLR8]|uniref:hypothetical protein n=1 Tax=Rhizobium sp. NZLR8 TaxID=2731104 RepID=UPI001C82E7D4|nr:hypothetical protein [Rhizobium sp. NZLR8]MBX5160403.1 hypothetical protein [Rhizobium sp. NZLR8]
MTTVSDYEEWSKTYGCKPKDFETQQAFEGCVSERKEKYFADIAQAQATVERQQTMEYVGMAAVVVVALLLVLARRPTWRLIEGLFISSAAKTISTKRDLTAYKDDVARRIREKADSK